MSADKIEHLQKIITNLQSQHQVQTMRNKAANQTMGEMLANNVDLRAGNMILEGQIKSLTTQLDAANTKLAEVNKKIADAEEAEKASITNTTPDDQDSE